MPTPKNEDRTNPNAASSRCFVVARIHCTTTAPSKPAPTAPAKIATGFFVMPHKNPSATPGKTAWESASPIKANLRTTRNAPIKPQHNPSSIEPASA